MTKSYLDATRTELQTSNFGIFLRPPRPPKKQQQNTFSCCTFDSDGAQTHATDRWWRNSQHTLVTRWWWETSYGAVFKATDMQLTLMQVAPPSPKKNSVMLKS